MHTSALHLSTRNVSIKQIRAFVAVASEANFAKAAKVLNVSASALSLMVQELERRVDQKLFERTTRTVTLTEAGTHFLPVANRLLEDFSRAVEDVARFPEVSRDSLRLGASQPFLSLIAPQTLRALRRDHPGLAIQLCEGTTQDLINLVANGELDLAIAPLWSSQDRIAASPLVDDRFGILTSASNPLAASEKALSWRDLGDEPLVSFMVGAGTRERVEKDPLIANLISQARHEASSLAGLSALIESGAGSAITAALTAEPFDDRFRFIPLAEPVAWRTTYLLMPRDEPPTPLVRDAVTALGRQLERFGNRPHMRIRTAEAAALH